MIDIALLLMAEATPKPPQNPMQQFLFFIILIGVAFYFIILRPQKREQGQKERMLSQLERGDRVITIGGIHGVVSGVDETRKTVTIDVGKNIKIEFSRSAVSTVEKKGKKGAEESAKEEDKT